MSSANNESFTSSFPIRMPSIPLSCPIAVAKTSNTMLKRSGESGHPCLVPDFKQMLSVSYYYYYFRGHLTGFPHLGSSTKYNQASINLSSS